MPTKSDIALRHAASVYSITQCGILIGPRGQLEPKLSQRGYPHVSIRIRPLGIDQKITVHRIAAFQKFGEAVFADGVVVRHRNSNKLDFRPSNILLGSDQDNFDDNPPAIRKRITDAGRAAAIKLRRFNPKQVAEIKRLYEPGIYGYKKIAKRFACSPATVFDILTGKLYR